MCANAPVITPLLVISAHNKLRKYVGRAPQVTERGLVQQQQFGCKVSPVI